MDEETVTRSKQPIFQRFSTGFDVLTTNTSPLDPVDPRQLEVDFSVHPSAPVQFRANHNNSF